MARILVVDDEPHVRELLTVILTAEGHEVQPARDGNEALGIVRLSMPDLVVLDLAMPEMDGWRFLEELYIRDLRRRTRVVIVSGQHDELPERGSEEQTNVGHFLAKPFEPASLIALVDDALSQEPEELFERRGRSRSLVRLLELMDDVME